MQRKPETGYRIERVRAIAGMTAQELGEALGKEGNTAVGFVSQLERGRRKAPPTQAILMAIAEAVARDDLDGKSEAVFRFLIGLDHELDVTIMGFREAPVSAPTGASFAPRTVHPLEGGPKEGDPAETEAPRTTQPATTGSEDQMSYSVPRRLRPVPSPSRVIRHHPDRTRRCAPLLSIDDVDDAWDLSPWCIRGHLLTPDNTTHWKSDKGRTRRCKKCERDRARRRRMREREKRTV